MPNEICKYSFVLAALFLQSFATNTLAGVLPQTGWSLLSVDSEETVGENGAAVNAFDGNPSTLWHTNWSSGSTPHPHDIRIALGDLYELNGFRYLPRQDGGDNGRINQYAFYVSTDGVNWGTPAATGTFADNASEQEVLFAAPVAGAYVRLVALSAYDGDLWTTVAEITALGNLASGNQAPNSTINTPGSDQIINIGDTLDFTGTGSDAEGDLPLTYLWSFGAGAGIPDANVEDPGLVQFNNEGMFTVSFTVTDALGQADPTPDVRIITVQATPPQPIPQTGWSLLSVDSEETVGENGAAVNAFDGDPSTLWHTNWVGGSPTHPHDIRIALGDVYQLNGFRYLPRQDGGDNGRINQYAFYVSIDGVNWGTPAATGTFADNASEQEVLFAAPVAGAYVRLVALSAYDGDPWTTVAEITVLGNLASGNQAPNSIINTPGSDLIINIGDTLDFNGSGSDAEGDLPLTYLWSFGAGAGIPDANVEDPGLVQFNNEGMFTVSFTVTDALGQADPTPDVRIITVSNQAPPQPIPQTSWSLLSVDSEETVGESGAAVNAFDGDPSTLWHTNWGGGSPTHPHDIRIALGDLYELNGFRHLPRQDGGDNGRIKQYAFYVSIDGVNWGTPAATGTFADTASGQEVLFAAPATGAYVRLVALSAYDGDPWTTVAEITVLGNLASGNQAPNSTINTPGSDQIINIGDTLDFTGTGSDAEGDLPLTYLWSFGAGAGIPDASVEDPGLVQFNNEGVFTVSFTVTDALGQADPTPDVRIITVSNQAPPQPIPQTSWSLLSVDSEETIGENGAAVNTFDGDPSTFWHTNWSGGSPTHPHDIRIALGGLYELNGFRYLPRQDGGDNGRINQYAFYVSIDGVNWGTPAATSTFADNASEQEVLFAAPVAGAYVRLVALSAYDGDPWTTVAEITVLGNLASGNQAPNSTINTPGSDQIINIGDTLDFTGSGSDAEGDLPLTYLWSFGAGAGIPDANVEDPGLMQFNNEGVFTVSFTVTDSLGQVDPTPDVRVIDVCTPPTVSILEPESKYIQTSSTLYVRAHPCLDNIVHDGWGVRFTLKNSLGTTIAQADDTETPYQTEFTGVLLDEHIVQATIIDQFGFEVGGPDTSDQISQIGIGDYYVTVGDSITLGLGDDLPSDDVSVDGRNTLGGYQPVLNNLLTSSKEYPHTVINKGVAGDTSIEGLLLMPSILAAHPDAQYFLIQHGTNDAGIPLPSGLNLQAGQSGYNGSFKDNLQQIITLVTNENKHPYLAKAPFAKGPFSGRNTLIQEYNQVIDELIFANNIGVTAPDFYTYFESNQNQYADNLHPNGAGYQSMADMWFNALNF